MDHRDDEYKKRGPITDFTIPEDDVNAIDPQRPTHLVYVQSFLQRVPLPPVAPSPLPQVNTNPITTNPIVNHPSTRLTEELERSLLSAQEEIRVLRMQQASRPDVPSLSTTVPLRHRLYAAPTPLPLVNYSYIPDDVREEKMNLVTSSQHYGAHARVKSYQNPDYQPPDSNATKDPDDDDRKRRNLDDDLPGLIEDIDR